MNFRVENLYHKEPSFTFISPRSQSDFQFISHFNSVLFPFFDVISFSVNLSSKEFRKILSWVKIQHFPISEQSHCTVVMKTSGSRKYRIRQGLDLLQIYPLLVDFRISFCPPPPHTHLLWLKISYLKRTSYFIPFRFVVVFTTIAFVQQIVFP